MSERNGKILKDYSASQTAAPQPFGFRQQPGSVPPREPSVPNIANQHSTSARTRNKPDSGGAAGSLAPFTVYLFDDDPREVKIGAGVLVTNVAAGTTQAVSGLSTAIPLGSTTKIWFKATFSIGLVLGTVEVASGTSWPASLVHFTGTPPSEYQDFGYVKVGEVISGEKPAGVPGFQFAIGASPYYFKQHLNTNLAVAACAVDGKAAKIFVPFPG